MRKLLGITLASFIVKNHECTLIKWLRKNFDTIPESVFFKAIRNKDIKVNGKNQKDPKFELSYDDQVEIYDGILNKYENIADTQDSMEYIKNTKYFQDDCNRISIIYESEDLIVVDKPSGISSQKGTDVKYSIVDILKHITGIDVHLVHRLDKETSGVIVFAKNPTTASILCKEFEEKNVYKEYFAVLHGRLFKKKFVLEKYITRIYGKWGDKMSVVDENVNNILDGDYYKLSKTTFELQEEVIVNGKYYSLVKLIPETGRKHQLRVHCEFLGNPIVGDVKYSNICRLRYINFDNSKSFQNNKIICVCDNDSCRTYCDNCKCLSNNRLMLHCSLVKIGGLGFKSQHSFAQS
jgi:23S rRNA pseudouridine955/2504/2580 synthase